MPFTIVRNDITKMRTDAIVNPSNTKLKMGGGVSGAILAAAGSEELLKECDSIAECKVGEAVITGAYNLPSKYIIHTVGPKWRGGKYKESELLYNCYKNSMKLALENKCKSIAFPLISSGTFGYPKDKALTEAVKAISDFILNYDLNVYLVVFDKKAYKLSEKLLASVEKYIDDNYVDIRLSYYSNRTTRYNTTDIFSEDIYCEELFEKIKTKEYSSQLSFEEMPLEPSFSQTLIDLMIKKGKTSVEVYKKANIDKKLFAKIIGKNDYHPSKKTALALAIALELNLDQTLDFLRTAGYTLSHSNKADLIIEYFINKSNYNIFEINEVLFEFQLPTLGY